MNVTRTLPDFPWDSLAEAKAKAAEHPGGIVDLSIGTPVDPTPEPVQRALAEAANWPGYPTTAGTPELRRAQSDYLARRFGVAVEPTATLPVIGTKEVVAWLPTLIDLGPGDLVVGPSIAYPTYAVGAALAGTEYLATDDPAKALGAKLVWLNSPSNPTGRISGADELTAWVRWAREHSAILVADECYAEFGWDSDPLSILSPEVSGGDHRGLLVLHSLSKRSNLAGYRAGFVAGDPELVAELLAVRKHAGLIVPGPVQAAAVSALADQTHVEEQRRRYLARRELLAPALEAAGFRIEHSEGSLYLWATQGADSRDSVDFLAERGILVAPGDFYGDAESGATRFVRVALTATDERIAAATDRLRG
ncbi:succinyldiaminopimelate transaminase [Naumannella halotolerans]|uniref:succinyldiaminopimelate transaminase n=1 Tax=Naumannella halotolerans TaxID=993414 RepID=UPI00370DB347